MTLWKTVNIGIAAVIMILGLSSAVWAGDARQALSQDSTLEQVLKRNTLRVGFSTFKPWAMKSKNGEFVGFEIDVAKRLADEMGVKIRFIPTKWDGIIPALLTGKFDIIIGGMGITPKRNLKVNFSDPYEFTGMSIVANKDSAPGKTSLADLNKASTKVSVRLGTTAEKAAKNFLPKAELLKFNDEAASIQELLNGRVSCLVASNPLPESLAKKYPEKLYLPMKEDFTKEPIGFAIRKGDPDFLNFLNNWIKVTNSEGWLDARFDYWFKTDKWKSIVE
ncbi:transporter substrate-binding domain-containing protein [Maridesulfovibrio hydrothermalis]|uniref:Extracellular solute-binding protein family 3 n=1 Tax=Maridesulfovibrio hydrothermalis AM13 = DSM 14728 TaxID=1121451 RepID=L0RCZ4_9BACT|nr:transporter substrate-binding domain-containing protein [Maridesulfovibrio hydrothermalis]CCO24629.1 Extracellular solute-binding protein family 3 [Maridesulfovibrio hydrothermalis AM13 = DSM 14728]